MKTILMLLTITFIFISCNGNKNVKTQKNVNYLKAKINTNWLYTGELLKEKKDITIKITTQNAKGVLTDNKSQTYTKDKDGYKNQYYYWIKYPIMKGNTWIVNNSNGKDTSVATIESTNTTFKFGEDKIKNCLKVSYVKALENGGRSITIRIFCPDLWMVKMETFYENQEGIATKQSSFNLKSFVY